jgi:phosphinothricin acetyltransferase
MRYVIDTMKPDDWGRVRAIYLEGIAAGDATFETDAPAWDEWDSNHLPNPRLVARDADTVLGWAALSPVSRRRVYAGVGEVSVYVCESARGLGLGRALLEALIEESEGHGVWTLQAGIFPENIPSIKLHLRCGFRLVGRRERIGKLKGVWRDTILFERRSQTVGI